MIRIQKVNNSGKVQPSRALTAEETPTVIAGWGDASDYIFFQAGDETSTEWTAYQALLNANPSDAELSSAQISRYTSVVPELLAGINKLNTEAGVTTAIGNQLERDYDEVTRALTRGYFGLALYRLSELPATGISYEGQDLKAHWTNLIILYKTANELY